jgi:hypothetical protein
MSVVLPPPPQPRESEIPITCICLDPCTLVHEAADKANGASVSLSLGGGGG